MARLKLPQHSPSKKLHPVDEFLQVLCNSPAAPAGALTIKADSRVHRYPVKGDRSGDKSGFYKFYANGIPAGFFGSWKGGEFHQIWHASGNFSAEEWAAYKLQAEADAAERELELAKRRAEASKTAAAMGQSMVAASPDHPYLVAKKVEPHGIAQTVEEFPRLAVPVYVNGQHTSWQFISNDGKKQFMSDGELKGGYFQLGDITKSNKVFLCEGFATAAAVFEETGIATFMSFSAHNLTDVAVWMRSNLGLAKDIVIVADNDTSKTGEREAAKASKASQSRVILIPMAGMDANDYRNAGYDLNGILTKRQWLTILEDFIAKRESTKWLIENWLPAGSLSMIFGDPGVGKSFLALDWALSIATGLKSWCGREVSQGNVVYLAGEGHAGLKKRIVGWFQEHKIVPKGFKFWVAEFAVDLNTDDGINQAIADIKELGVSNIALIFVDTLNRFLNGDENSAQDARAMIDACGKLQRTFGCAVSLIHHTGVSLEAKNRARGSSAWLGALDCQFQVKTDSNYYMTLSQMKQKDIEKEPPLALKLEKIPVLGWLKKDGTNETTLVLKQRDTSDEPDDQGNEAENQKLHKALHVFTQAANDKDMYGYSCAVFNEDGTCLGVKTEKWFEFFSRDYKSKDGAPARKDTVKKSFDRTKSTLKSDGWIIEEGEVCWITDKWKSSGRGLQLPKNT